MVDRMLCQMDAANQKQKELNIMITEFCTLGSGLVFKISYNFAFLVDNCRHNSKKLKLNFFLNYMLIKTSSTV